MAKSEVMRITVERKPAGQMEAEALIVPVFEGRRVARFGAADLFDSVRYGHRSSNADRADQVRDLDTELVRARPLLLTSTPKALLA